MVKEILDFFTVREQIDSTSTNSWMPTVSFYAVLILSSLFVLIVFHGNTYLSVMTHDTFVYFDGAHRLSMGQTPHIDFHTPLGAAAYLLPYWGLLQKGSYAGSLELASFLVAAVLTLFSILLLRGRSTALFSVITIFFLSLIVAVPMNVGTQGTIITHAMYYNSWGWAALTIAFITYITPRSYSTNRLALEAVLLALLIVFLFYLKVSYFVFALVFLFVLAFASRRQLHLAINTVVISLVFWVLIEWQFGLTRPYIEDLRAAIIASGAMRQGLFSSVADNVGEFLLVITALSIMVLKKAVRWSDFLFVAFVGSAGLVILNQNAQSQNIVVILAVLLWAYAVTLRTNEAGESRLPVFDAGDVRLMAILLILFIAPTSISGIRGIYSLTMGVATGAYQNQVTTLHGVYVGEKKSYLEEVHAEADPVLLFNKLRADLQQWLSQGEYVQTINEGLRLFEAQNVQSGKIVTFDQANPFNFLTGGPPPKNDYSWFHAGRNISKNAHESAQDLFEDVSYIMMPTFPMSYNTTRLLWEIYGEYVEREYVVLAKSMYWTLYGHPGVAPVANVSIQHPADG